MNLTTDQRFENHIFTPGNWQVGEYESCTFLNCDFSQIDLAEHKFMECEFVNCDLSNVNIQKCAFQEIEFTDCKMLGLQFDTCNPFAFEIRCTRCMLNHSNFYQVKLLRAEFKECSMQEVDFSEADLKEATLTGCDLHNAQFDNSNLENAYLRNSYNFHIDPERNTIRGATFSRNSIEGLLHKFGISIE